MREIGHIELIFRPIGSLPSGTSSSPSGASIYDVRKILGFFYPLPPGPCHKSADFVPFLCFLGTPHPLRTSYMEAPLADLA